MLKLNRHIVNSSLSWKSAEMIVGYGINLILKLILVRLLMPEQFGLIGMALVFERFIAEYTDLGLGAALIQRKESELRPIHWSSVFWCNMIVSWLGFIIIACLVSRLASYYYGLEIIYHLVILISLQLIWAPFIFIQRIKLIKNLKFKKLFFISISNVFVGGIVGVVMAYNGFGVWSLIGQTLAGSLVMLPITWALINWKPTCNFEYKAVREMLTFGTQELSARVIGFFHKNVNVLILGGFFSPTIVGYFVFARTFTLVIFGSVMKILNKVFFPYFSQIQDDLHQIKSITLERVKLVTMIFYPLSVFIYFLLPKLIYIIGGDKWEGAVYPLKLLSIVIIIRSMEGDLAIILKSLGIMRKFVKLHFINFLVIKMPIVLIGCFYFDFTGFLIGLIITQIITLITDFLFVAKYINLKPFEIIIINLTNLLIGLIIGFVIGFFNYIVPEVTISSLLIISFISVLVWFACYNLLSKKAIFKPYLFESFTRRS